jgi:hypothetical protein
LVGGVIGALAGGIPTYFIARLGSREVLARDQEARIEQEKTTAFRAHVRIAELVNGILSLDRQLESMLADAGDNPQMKEHPWLVVRPFAGLSEERVPAVDASEAAIFVAAGAIDYVNDLLLLPNRYLALVGALKEYARKRELLALEMPPPDAFEGELASSFLSPEKVKQLMPRMIELNSLIAQIRAFLSDDKKMALRLAREFGPILKKYFKVESFPGFDLDQLEAPTVAHTRGHKAAGA